MSRYAKLLAAAALAFAAQTAHAQGWYAGVDIGATRTNADFSEIIFGAVSDQSSATGFGFRVRGGYQLGRHFAVEAGYTNFGNSDFTFSGSTTHTSSDAFHGALVGIIPIGDKWVLDGKFGIIKMTVSTRQSGNGSTNESERNGGVMFCIGAGYHIDDHWDLRIDWSGFQQVDFGLTLGGGLGAFSYGDSALASVGAEYRW